MFPTILTQIRRRRAFSHSHTVKNRRRPLLIDFPSKTAYFLSLGVCVLFCLVPRTRGTTNGTGTKSSKLVLLERVSFPELQLRANILFQKKILFLFPTSQLCLFRVVAKQPQNMRPHSAPRLGSKHNPERAPSFGKTPLKCVKSSIAAPN